MRIKMLNKIKQVTIFITVFIFFSHLPEYWSTIGYPGFAPLFFIVLTIATTSLFLVLTDKSFNFLKLPIYQWILFYFVIISIWFLLPTNYLNDQEIRQIILPIIYLSTISALIFLDDNKMTMSRKAVFIVTIVAIFNNIYEFINPEAFFPRYSEYGIYGRSAGYYVNANTSGVAILLGLIFSYTIVPQKLKIIFLAATFIGVLLTFSRGGILGWFVIFLFLNKEKIIDQKKAILITLLGVAFIMLLPFFENYIALHLGRGAGNILNRLNFFTDTTGAIDESQIDRLTVAKAGFVLFADNPILGAGLNATRHWAFSISTHNIYLKLMAEFGIIGIFIYPLLILSSVWHARGETKKIARVYFVYMLMLGLFTHNVLDAYHILFSFALMTNLSYRSKYGELSIK